jgi:hypothetical protein
VGKVKFESIIFLSPKLYIMPYTNHLISTGHARKLAQNFLRNKWMTKSLKDDDSKAVWFSKEVLLTALGLDPATDTGIITGVRFYFAAYEDSNSAKIPPKDKKDKGKVTLVMVQTEKGNGDPVDKDILSEPDAQSEYDAAWFKEFNDGQLCPPPACDNDGLINTVFVRP